MIRVDDSDSEARTVGSAWVKEPFCIVRTANSMFLSSNFPEIFELINLREIPQGVVMRLIFLLAQRKKLYFQSSQRQANSVWQLI